MANSQDTAPGCPEQSGPKRNARTAGPERCDPHLLEPLYRRERGSLVRFLRRRVGDDLASDLAQEVFLRAAASGRIAELANPAAYLQRIARNMLIDRARRHRASPEPLPLIDALDAVVAAEQEYGLALDDLRLTLELALAQLPDKTRRVFVMHRFEHLAYREIHNELGISVAAVEYHMMRALAHVRAAITASV